MKRHCNLIVFEERQKKQLRRPFGKYATVGQIRRTKRKIISVGDETTLNLIAAGIRPHLAVCDFRIKRVRIGQDERNRIITFFGKARHMYKNAPGTLSLRLLNNAGRDIPKGGLIRIIGEEDISALAYMLYADERYLVLYGQPGKGMVAVKPESKKLKMRIKKLLAKD